jgi:FkbH-like protein
LKNINNYSLPEIQEYIDNQDLTAYSTFNILLLRNITIEAIKPYLEYLSIQMGFRPNIVFGNYDNVLQDANSDILINQNTDCIMIFTNLKTLSPKLVNSFSELDLKIIEEEKNFVKNYIVSTLRGIRDKTNAIINWHSFELPIYPAFGVLDHGRPDMQIATIRELNDFLKNQLIDFKNGFYIEMNNILSIVGYKNFYDNRYWHIGKAPYKLDALKEISIENFKLFRALKGKNKKCLVLDCDNTLWGGIVGEDGIEGIKLSPNFPGSAYLSFQEEILSLYHRGIIIALCSKNNEIDVWDVVDNHPHMLIKRNHISTAMINWNDKASNIKEIADNLNIGLDSIVFIDDNEFEINLVKSFLPVVDTIHLPKGKSADYKDLLSSSCFFDTLTFTDEDKKRGKLYKTESIRKEDKEKYKGNMESYYETLDMSIQIDQVNKGVIPRVAQLTQKTNQFNLTTKRYSESDIEEFMNNKNSDVLHVKLKDRFGDMGIVGVCIINYSNNFAEVDTFLLSCRALGRGVENILINALIKLTQIRKLKKIKASYIPTNKNKQVLDFYTKNKFVKQNEDKHKVDFLYEFITKLEPLPSYFKEIKINL